ncbi:unnamed protein product [Caenorhabditis nigoni]
MTIAHLKAKRLAEADGEWEKKARNAVAELVTEANLGAQGEITQLNPLVPVSKATALKLSNELDEMISNVKHVDSERIFVHDYNVDEVVQKEGNVHSTAVGKALAQLEGIEKALAGNLHMDIENRKSKQMWLATQNLKEIVVFDNRASCCMEERRAPLGDQMKTLLRVVETMTNSSKPLIQQWQKHRKSVENTLKKTSTIDSTKCAVSDVVLPTFTIDLELSDTLISGSRLH